MKRLTLFAAVLVLAACSAKEQAPAADTTAAAAAPAAAPAPAMADTTHKMDSAAAPKDTTKK